jgi:hypothetical protein
VNTSLHGIAAIGDTVESLRLMPLTSYSNAGRS